MSKKIDDFKVQFKDVLYSSKNLDEVAEFIDAVSSVIHEFQYDLNRINASKNIEEEKLSYTDRIDKLKNNIQKVNLN